MKLKKEQLRSALSLLQAEAKVLVPVLQEDGDIKFAPWDGKTEPCLSGNSKLPPKDAVFPKTEKMYRYNTAAGTVQDLAKGEKQVIFGIRPCDVKSLYCMDQVFLTKGYVDNYYKSKRDQLTTICVGCTAPAATCFCEGMGLDPANAPEADVQLNDLGDSFLVRANTERGQAVLELWKDLLEDSGDAKPEAVHCTLDVKKPEGLAEKLSKMFEHPIWEEVSQGCIGCGCCTYVCPTCYCFDIGQESHGSDGAAFRCWDSCMFSDYTRMAGGHNPRPSKKERLRNRYLHKLCYFDERYGETLCVGCGRCVANCPANLDISHFMELAGEVTIDG